jgi:hypothetical protein
MGTMHASTRNGFLWKNDGTKGRRATRTHRTRALSAIAVIALALGLAACGSDQQTQASAEQNLCSALGTFASAVQGLHGLSADSSKGDIQEQEQAVQNAWSGVQSAAQDVSQADTAAIESAGSDLQSAVDGLSSDTTVKEALPELQPQLQALAQAYKQTYDGLNCAALSAGTTSS